MTYFIGKAYKLIWHKSNLKDSTPTGFGIFLSLILIIVFSTNVDSNIQPVSNLYIIFFAGLIYLLDDLKGLHPWLRISIAFCTGILLFLNAVPDDTYTYLILLCLIFLFGLIAVGLTNVVNFYDGADLNLAIMIFISGLILVLFSDIDSLDLHYIGLVMIAFSFGFGIHNRIPHTLYLGDAGSFIVAMLLLYFIISFAISGINIPPELISVIALPLFDVFYVMLIRINKKHDMLSRNYLHLYQRISIRYKGFFHLIPQIVNVIAIILISKLVEISNIDRISALFLTSFLFTPVFYITCRVMYVEKSYFFGDGNQHER
jgi:UDP-N-acetylmuramyl pentapeptide phosphotransferase/UDP-N-acetylglucosamine-1-phosphate transferase